MRRREFIAERGSLAWPAAVRVPQTERVCRIGVLTASDVNELITWVASSWRSQRWKCEPASRGAAEAMQET